MDLAQRSSLSYVCIIEGEKKLTFFIASVFPNPVHDNVNLRIEAPAHTTATILSRDMAGRLLLQQTANLKQGSNLLSVYLGRLTNSVYEIEVISSVGKSSVKVVKGSE